VKPNEITQRDVEKWAHSTPIDQPCRHSVEADAGNCSSIDLADVRKMFDSIAAKARLADLGEQTSALAHELRQPLFSISVANENLRMMLELAQNTEPQLGRAVARIAEQIQRAQTIIDRTLAYASGQGAGAARADLGLAAGNAIRFLSPLFDAADIEIDDGGVCEGVMVGLCQVESEQIFVNFLRNAAESIEARREAGWDGQGRIAIRIETHGQTARCMVEDNGVGLPDDMEFGEIRPFFTTKPRTGNGLGLHICRQALARVGGGLRLMAGAGEGAFIRIDVPMARCD